MSWNRHLIWSGGLLALTVWLALTGNLRADQELIERFRDELLSVASPPTLLGLRPEEERPISEQFKKTLAERDRRLRILREQLRGRLGDILRILQMREWGELEPVVRVSLEKDNLQEGLLPRERMQLSNMKLRAELGDEFLTQCKKVAAGNDAAAQLAVANTLGEVGTQLFTSLYSEVKEMKRTVKDPVIGDRFEYVFTPVFMGEEALAVLSQLTRSAAAAVRSAAARSLGKVVPLPRLVSADLVRQKRDIRPFGPVSTPAPLDDPLLNKAAAPLRRLLLSGQSVEDQRAALEGLLLLVKTDVEQSMPVVLKKLEAPLLDRLPAAATVLPIVTDVLATAPADQRVRFLAWDVIKESGAAMMQEAEIISGGLRNIDNLKTIPLNARIITPEVNEQVTFFAKSAALRLEKRTLPILKILQQHRAPLLQGLADSAQDVRLVSRQALSNIGIASFQLRRMNDRVPQGVKESKDWKALLEAVSQIGFRTLLTQVVETLARDLGGDAQLKLGSIEVLEPLEDLAAPAYRALIAVLADCNPFVRWSAARTLGRIEGGLLAKGEEPVDPEAVICALARVLTDLDTDVRIAAAEALEQFRPLGSTAPLPPQIESIAIPALTQAGGRGDAEVRIVIMQVLGSLARNGAVQSVVPMLTQALSDPDSDVRRAAAETLGTFGPSAQAAVPALQKAAQDEVPEVRSAASEALLNIIR